MAAIKSQISKIVSSQIGPLQGKLRSTIQKKVLELLKEFANGCPNVERMKQILKIRNNLLKTIDSFQKRVDAVKHGTLGEDRSVEKAVSLFIKDGMISHLQNGSLEDFFSPFYRVMTKEIEYSKNMKI